MKAQTCFAYGEDGLSKLCKARKDNCEQMFVEGDRQTTCKCVQCLSTADCTQYGQTKCSGDTGVASPPVGPNTCYTPKEDCKPPSKPWISDSNGPQCSHPCTDEQTKACLCQVVDGKPTRLGCANGKCVPYSSGQRFDTCFKDADCKQEKYPVFCRWPGNDDHGVCVNCLTNADCKNSAVCTSKGCQSQCSSDTEVEAACIAAGGKCQEVPNKPGVTICKIL